MTTQFPFTIATEFPNLKVATDRLKKEILDNENILIALADVSTGNGVCYVTFRADLSPAEETELFGDVSPAAAGSIIGDHSGEPLEKIQRLDKDGVAYSKPQPQTVGYELCNKDIRLTPGKVDQAEAVEDLKVNVAENREEEWAGPECLLIGAYKPGAQPTDPWIKCTDQVDANANAQCSIWDYRAVDQKDGTTEIAFDIAGGSVLADEGLPLEEKWDHRVYAVFAPLIPAASGGSVRIFDGYMRPSGKVEEVSEQTRSLDPALGPSANTLRVWIFHPPIVSGIRNHVLRIKTYRPPTTT